MFQNSIAAGLMQWQFCIPAFEIDRWRQGSSV